MSGPRLDFRLERVATGSRARAATFRTLHGEVRTPVFMPVGTQATVKAQTTDTLHATGAKVLLANTYHLLLRPGPEVFRKLGGIHRFMDWSGSVLTDSGGFQIFSLPGARRMSEDGAAFKSYVDGTRILLSPEKSIETQRAIGSDIMMVLDQCVPSTCDERTARDAMELTHRWARRSLAARGDSPQAMFAIAQGACFEHLRRESAARLTELPFDGFAIGGLAVGETKAAREDFTELTASLLPTHLPRYLMGVGTPIDLLEAVHRGADMFDCILPTALAQQGVVYTSRGRLELRRGVYKLADEKLDPACGCATCARHSLAYLHHLVKTREVLGWHLLGVHNLAFYRDLMASLRRAILEDRFTPLYRELRESLVRSDGERPKAHPRSAKKPKPTSLGGYELARSAEGWAEIVPAGEPARSDPERRARERYAEPARLRERLGAGPVTLWDVGLGEAAVAMAAIRLAESLPESRLAVVSFDRDLEALRLALRHRGAFPHLFHPAPETLLARGAWSSADGRIRWEARTGELLPALTGAPAPQLIFYDVQRFASADPRLASVAGLLSLRAACGGGPVELHVDTRANETRAALLAAGFALASGESAPTTIAAWGSSPEKIGQSAGPFRPERVPFSGTARGASDAPSGNT